ncbi:hypothetical protein A2U01_0068489, partial [Trifolium medium]|nr:hypothetical protein [Trifolium medium]
GEMNGEGDGVWHEHDSGEEFEKRYCPQDKSYETVVPDTPEKRVGESELQIEQRRIDETKREVGDRGRVDSNRSGEFEPLPLTTVFADQEGDGQSLLSTQEGVGAT